MTEQATTSGEIVVHVFGRTDVGRTREHNEDSFIVADLTTMNATLQPDVREHRVGAHGSVFMVADGMGGAAAGEIASAMATEVVLGELDLRWRKAGDTSPEVFARSLKAAAEAANSRIHRYAADHPENRGMGTTATIAGILGDTLFLVQVGDSRAYIIRNGTARQITKDQSLTQKLIEAGEMTAEEAEVSERRNIILQALGPEPIVKVDLTSQQVRKGDTLVLCSDGMSGQMRADDIARIITETPDLVEACRRLIDLANENGGPDNITVVAARFVGDGLTSPADGEEPKHNVYAGEAGSRPTVPVPAAWIAELAAETQAVSPEAVTDEVVAVAGESGVGGRRAAGGAGRDAAPAVPAARADTTPTPVRAATPVATSPSPRPSRVPVPVLRLIFGGIAVLVAIYFILAALRNT